MDTTTNGWGATQAPASTPEAARARRLARALIALERWAEQSAEALTGAELVVGREDREAWIDGAQSGFADLAARLAELRRWLGVEGARGDPAVQRALEGARAWGEAELTEARRAAESGEIVDVERLHARGRAAALGEAALRLRELARPRARSARYPDVQTSRRPSRTPRQSAARARRPRS